MNVSCHYYMDRKSREELIQKIGEGKVIASFNVDRGHVNGPESHKITSNGIIVVYNAISNKLVTKLIARPGQIKRYYAIINKQAPKYLLDIASKHESLNYNK